MTDAGDVLWSCFDLPGPIFTFEQITSWPDGVHQQLSTLGCLHRTDNAAYVICPNCDDRHVEEVEVRESGGHLRFFIRCPQALRVEISQEQVLQWTVDYEAVAKLLAKAMRLSGKTRSLISGRLWVLGKTLLQSLSREVLLGRGLTWSDGGDVAQRISRHGRPIVLAVSEPPQEIWPGRVPAVIPLPGVATLSATGIELDVTQMLAWVSDVDANRKAAIATSLDPKEKRLIVRRQLKAELRSLISDEDIMNAYLAHGTVRATAGALMITKDKVSRVLLRYGGAKVVREGRDSKSIRRTVASQPRDRTKQFSAAPEQPED